MSRYGNTPDPQQQWGGGSYAVSVADAPVETRVDFIRKTYIHLVGAVLAFVGILTGFFYLAPMEVQQGVMSLMLGSRWSWLVVIGLFMGASWIATSFAQKADSPGMSYFGLGLYVVAEAVIFLPIIFIAKNYAPAGTIGSAALITAIIFAALTAYVFITKQDFSWLGGILWIVGFGAIGLIVAGMIFGWSFGLWFIVPMIAFAAGYILYHTSNLIHQYQPGQHVAASLALFASVALLFYYVLMLVMRLQDE